MTPYERLQEVCEQNGTTVTKFCFEIKKSKGNLATWKKGNFSSTDLAIIRERFNISTDWLLFGGNAIIPSPEYTQIDFEILLDDDRYGEITKIYAAAPSDEIKSALKGGFIELAKNFGIDTVPIIGY